jgi:hypothetical protein
MQNEGISEEEWLEQPEWLHQRYKPKDGAKVWLFPKPADTTAYSYDAVYAMALATCIGTDNKPLTGLPKVEFKGASGLVKFSPATRSRDPETAYMTFSTLDTMTDGTLQFTLINSYSAGWASLFKVLLSFLCFCFLLSCLVLSCLVWYGMVLFFLVWSGLVWSCFFLSCLSL